MAYHHFAAVDDVSRELVKYLKPGGTLAVADIAHVAEQPGDRDCDGGAPPPLPIMAGHEHIVAHTRGFSEEDIRGGVRRCRARERVLRTVHLGQTAGTRRALLPRHRYEAGRSRGGSIGKVYMYDPLMMMCFTVQQQIRQNEFHLQSCVCYLNLSDPPNRFRTTAFRLSPTSRYARHHPMPTISTRISSPGSGSSSLSSACSHTAHRRLSSAPHHRMTPTARSAPTSVATQRTRYPPTSATSSACGTCLTNCSTHARTMRL